MTLCSSWATEADLPETCDTSAVKPQTLTDALLYSSTILYDLTHRRYPGECADTYHPIACNGCWSVFCARGIGGNPHIGLELPALPVREVTSVTVRGETLDPSLYRLHDDKYLRRTDGHGWPCGCDLDDPEQFVVSYTWGRSPTAPLRKAAAILGWEFALSWTPECSGECRLPKRIQTITRQGVSFAVLDPLTLFRDGVTGVPDVDMLVAAHNRSLVRRGAVVAVPGQGPRGTRY